MNVFDWTGLPVPAARLLVGHRWVRWLVFGLLPLTVQSVRAQSLQDYFTNRNTITSTNGQISANNSGMTFEVGEPNHGGKPGGHSMWISWMAPTNGVAKFETGGSRFDTLLSAYRFASTNDTTFDRLIPVAVADDSEGFERESELEFGALAGQRYEIAVDGYFGAVGPLELSWDFKSTPVPPPVLLSTPPDRSVRLGDPVTLTVALSNVVSAQFKWYLNGNEIGVSTTNLFIPSFQLTNVGRYKMRISVGGEHYDAMPTELQINTDGDTGALARGKLLDTPGTPLIGQGFSGSTTIALARSSGGSTVSDIVSGYNGSQIFNTTYATVDTNEPPHCGFSGGTSYWLIYRPPTNGTLTLNTAGSTYDTVMETYTYNGVLTNYNNLITIACDHNSLGGTNGASRLQFPVVKARPYVIAVQGVNGSRGTAWLNYNLNTNQLPSPPSLLSPPTAVLVGEGSPATLAASLAGCPPLRYTWKKNTTLLPGATAPTLFFASTTLPDSASYVVTVTNDLGTLSVTLPLQVIERPVCSIMRFPPWAQLSFPTINGMRYTVEESPVINGPWQPWSNFYFGNGSPLVVYLVTSGSAKFFRVRVE